MGRREASPHLAGGLDRAHGIDDDVDPGGQTASAAASTTR